MSKKAPLFPHTPKKKESLFPHRPGSTTIPEPLASEGYLSSPEEINLLAKTEGNPISKYCCRQCGDCAPEELLEEGKFLERISWLRRHYTEKHPGIWGKG